MGKHRLFDYLVAPAALFLILLIGHYGLYFGDSFFVEEDPVTVLGYHSEDAQSGGWRPGLGLGMSYYFADPGSMHTWSVFRWWHQLFSNDSVAFNISVFALMWVACIAQYSFLRIAVPKLNAVVAVLLSSIIAFGPLRYEVFFIRSSAMMPISAVFLALILRKFYEQPLCRYYFIYTFVMSFTLLLGSSACLLQALIFSFVFFLAQIFYQYFYEESRDFLKPIKNYIFLNFASGVSIFLLGGWVFYSIFVESQMVEYLRDPDYSSNTFFTSPSLSFTLNQLIPFFHSGLISLWSGVLGIEQTISIHSWKNVSPVFPVILLVALFHKSKGFWEFAAKLLVLGILFYEEICAWIPGIVGLTQSILNLYPPTKMFPFIMSFEILIFAVLITRFEAGEVSNKLTVLKILKWVALIISLIYTVLFLTAFMAIVTPHFLSDFFQTVLSRSSLIMEPAAKVDFFSDLISANVRLFNETMGFSYLLFYGTTVIFFILFSTRYWPQFLSYNKGRLFAIALLVNSIFLSWAVYPLNKAPLIWNEQAVKGIPIIKTFEPTDRLVRVHEKKCAGRSDYFACINKKFFTGEFGQRRYLVGYTQVPTFELSARKPYTQKESAELIDFYMKKEGVPIKGIRRHISNDSSIYSSRLYDITAVNYLLSQDRLPESEHLKLVYKNKQFYLYQNLRAWPYYYFADRVETIETYEDLYDAEKGAAYFWKDGPKINFPSKSPDHERMLELIKFDNGDVEFKYSSDEREFLVIADAWHPNWRASINGKDIPIVKTNGVFKGVLLPPGEGTVHFFFDSSPYQFGVWVSAVSWTLFLFGWAWSAFRLRERC